MDRYRLVLDIFANGAVDRRAALQVEAATLKYELPRLRQTTDASLLNRATEKGSPVLDAERRIDKIESKLAELAENVCEQRKTRRRAGYGHIAIAGYTNAGKTTLLQRLADDLSVTEQEDTHQDLHTTTPIEDHLFVTLETISRGGDVGGLPVIYTDTVGFIEALPHGLVESFSATLDEVATADVALLVIDATDTPERIREKVRVSLEALDERPSNLIGILNKIDSVDEISERRAAVREFVSEVVTVSALEGTGIDRLRERLYDALPTDRATFDVRNDSGAQAFISWAHNHGVVETHYEGDVVRIELEARSNIIERARSRVEGLDD